MNKSRNALDAALSLWRRGLSVIPVPRPDATHDGKVPSVAWREYQRRLPSESEIRQWFSGEPSNIAIVTGRVSGVVVVDADSPAALRWCTRRLVYTPWQCRTARGFHLFYQHPGGQIRNRVRLATSNGRLPIDVRGDGGYVIAPSSVHKSGVVYEFAGDWSSRRETVPRFLPRWVERQTPSDTRPPRSLARPIAGLVERARAYLAAIPRPELDQGSDAATLYAACRLVRGFGLSPADATPLLWEWAGNRPGWTYDWIACKVNHAERYGTEPIGALR